MSYVDQLLGENEHVVLVARQSWVVLVREALIDLILAIVVIGFTLVAIPLVPQPWGYAVALLMLIPAFRFAMQYINWSNREYIVTNRRVIQTDGVVNKNVIDSSLEKVNDVRMRQSVLGRLFNYGDVEILTASELGTNEFKLIGDPIKFKTAMLNEKEKLGFDELPAAIPAGPKPNDIPALIAALSALRSQGMLTEEEFQKKKAELLARM
jgi:uncharacterized membrane protein YdbT with pleckstrin-like domain